MTWIVEVTSAAKIYTPSKHVVYAIQVMRSPTEEPYFVYRRYNDLYDLQVALLKMFPVEAGKAGVPRCAPDPNGHVFGTTMPRAAQWPSPAAA